MQHKVGYIILLFSIAIALSIIGISYYYTSVYKSESVPLRQPSDNSTFSDFYNRRINKKPQNDSVTLIAVGDISYSRGVEQMVRKYNDIYYPFSKIRDYFESGDIVFGNLETPITEGREIRHLEMIFRSNPGTEDALKNVGFSILSLANNHTPNFGEKGLMDTFDYLNRAGIKYIGAGKNEEEAYQPEFIEKKGIKFAFLAYNDTDVVPDSYRAGKDLAGTAFMDINKMSDTVKEIRNRADFIIVSMHSGFEYVENPNTSQITFAHAAIDAGADLVIGHHPHVVQTMEKYKEKYIFYSLGNFIFDQSWSQETKDGLILKVFITKEGIQKFTFLPVVSENLAQPRMANDQESKRILKRLQFPHENMSGYYWDKNIDNLYNASRSAVYVNTQKKYGNIIKEVKADLDNDTVNETYFLSDGILTVLNNQTITWKSPKNWWIDDFILADSNNDGIDEINVSLWKSGNFGRSKPFWENSNDISVRNHFFVYTFIDGSMKLLWGSSNLANPNCEFDFADIDGDKKNELIAIEGEYSDTYECYGEYIAVWKWNEWGFSNEWRSGESKYSNLEIEKIDGKNHVLFDLK